MERALINASRHVHAYGTCDFNSVSEEVAKEKLKGHITTDHYRELINRFTRAATSPTTFFAIIHPVLMFTNISMSLSVSYMSCLVLCWDSI